MFFRWFLDMNMFEKSFISTVLTKNRERHDIAKRFFAQIVVRARATGLMSDGHFTVDGTLIQAWASHKSFRRKDSGLAPTAG